MDLTAGFAGIMLGAVLGFTFRRGRFCLNTAFRNILYIQNYTLFRSYLLSLVIAMAGSNLLEQSGILSLDQGRQEFAWLANVIGGYLFGVGMVLAGGCASGTWFRTGEGLIGSWMAALGFMLGAASIKTGALAGVYAFLRGFVIAPDTALTIDGVFGINRWVIIAVVSAGALAVVSSERTSLARTRGELTWRSAGLLIGALVVLAWYVSFAATGEAVGLSFTGPSEKALRAFTDAGAWDWETAVLAGFPIGAFISARMMREFAWRAPRADVIAQQFGGGLIMGMGGMLAGGCPIGHGITGIAALSVPSLVSMVFIVLGSWTMVYVLFMRSSSDE